MTFTQMEGCYYKCGAKGHFSNTCTKNVPKGQWYMDKMKMQDAQLTQASGVTTSTIDDWSTTMGTTPATNGSSSQGTASQGANRPLYKPFYNFNMSTPTNIPEPPMGGTEQDSYPKSKEKFQQQLQQPWQGLQIHKSGTIYSHSYVQTNKHMYDWILLNTCSSINIFCN